METVIQQTQTLINKPFLIDKAHTIQMTFYNLNSAFSTVDKSISYTAHLIDYNSLPYIQTAIDKYMTVYSCFIRKSFHTLEKVSTDWASSESRQPPIDEHIEKNIRHMDLQTNLINYTTF